MLKEAVKAVKSLEEQNRPLLLGVTVLTSMKTADLREIGMNRTVANQVKRFAKMAKNAGLKGFVCSTKEIDLIRKIIGKDGIIVVPGIRLKQDNVGDQKRVATPREAISLGADYLVMGRSIIKAKDQDVHLILDKIEKE
jgi:orotidine-5'-phosphate decarboxylase